VVLPVVWRIAAPDDTDTPGPGLGKHDHRFDLGLQLCCAPWTAHFIAPVNPDDFLLETHPLNSNTQIVEPATFHDDEIDLFELVHSLWRQRGLIVGFVIAAVLAIGSFHLSALGIPSAKILQSEVLFTFSGAENGKYPDGTPFLHKDLLSNDILIRTIANTSIEVPIEKLAQSLSISPGSALVQQTESALNDIRTDDKTPSDLIEELESRLGDARSLTNKTAILQLDLTQAGLSEEQGKKLISQLLERWPQRAAQDFGVTQAKIALPLQPFSWDQDVDIAVNIDALSQRLTTIERSIRSMRTLPGIETTNDGQRSIVDLESRARLLREARLDPLRSFVYHYYALLAQDSITIRIQRDGRIRTLELTIQEKTRLVDSYSDALSELTGMGSRPMGQAQASLEDGPGVDGSFLNEMLKLGEQLGDQQMKQELQNKRLALIEEISTLRQELELIRGVDDLSFTISEVEQYIDNQFPNAVTSVNQLRDEAEVLLAVISERSLSNQQNLYQKLSPIQLAQTGYQPQKLSLQLALAVVLGGMIGCLVALIRTAAFNRRRAEHSTTRP